MNMVILLALFLPLLSSVVLFLAGGSLSKAAIQWCAVCAVIVPFTLFASSFFYALPGPFTLSQWVRWGSLHIDFEVQFDALSRWMALIITGVGGVIHLYSCGYMEHDCAPRRYFALMNLFIFAMLLLVLANHLALLLIGWEGVGIASYLLIGHYQTQSTASQAAYKAFLYNKFADLFLIGAILLLISAGKFGNFSSLNSEEMLLPTFLPLCLFLGAIGKSAQFPLHAWLPDAMAGPTPVSALIHAATMVTAGIYLFLRTHPLFFHATEVTLLIGIVGGITALGAALCACSQSDLKRVLAYSTLSQLGIMWMGCSIFAIWGVMLHLLAHAFTKALLFLTSGDLIVLHHGRSDMALLKKTPLPNRLLKPLFLLGTVALAGIPPLFPFFSKHLLMEASASKGAFFLFTAILTTSVLTALYLAKAYQQSFAQEVCASTATPLSMRISNILLALGVLLGPLVLLFWKLPANAGVWVDWTTCIALLPVLGALWIGMISKRELPVEISQMFAKGFFYDSIVFRGCVYPIRQLSQALQTLERWYSPAGHTPLIQRLKTLSKIVPLLENGQTRLYASWMFLGVALFLSYMML